jgi:hypothetical protein
MRTRPWKAGEPIIVSRLWACAGHPKGTPGHAQGDIFKVPPYCACDVDVTVAGAVTSIVPGDVVAGAVVAGVVGAGLAHATRTSTKQMLPTSVNTFFFINASSSLVTFRT